MGRSVEAPVNAHSSALWLELDSYLLSAAIYKPLKFLHEEELALWEQECISNKGSVREEGERPSSCLSPTSPFWLQSIKRKQQGVFFNVAFTHERGFSK